MDNVRGFVPSHYPPQQRVQHQPPHDLQVHQQDLEPLRGQQPLQVYEHEAVDFRLLLPVLAEQYVNSARSLSANIVYGLGATAEDYARLMANALACYDAVLKTQKGNLRPRQVALIELRYSSLLFEETSNQHEIEERLTKSIMFCELNRLIDIRYHSQHLMARVMAKSLNFKAAYKMIDEAIEEALVRKHVPWVYAFRFLRISLSNGILDRNSTLNQAQKCFELAKQNGEKHVAIVASMLLASIHLKTRESDSISDAQRAIAQARAELNSLSGSAGSQLESYMSMLDLACYLDPFDQVNSTRVLKFMQTTLDKHHRSITDDDQGLLLLPLHQSSGNLGIENGGVFQKGVNGQDSLVLSWRTSFDVYLSGYLLCVCATHPSKISMAEFAAEGFRFCGDDFGPRNISRLDSLEVANERKMQRMQARCYFCLYSILLSVDNADWAVLEDRHSEFNSLLDKLERVPLELETVAFYLQGVVFQAKGQFSEAIKVFMAPDLTIPPVIDRSASHTQLILAVLAAMNALVIIRGDTSLQNEASALFSSLSQHFPDENKGQVTVASSNPHLVSAYKFVMTLYTLQTLGKKQHLQASLKGAKLSINKQLLALGTNYLFEFMCKGMQGERNVHSARAALVSARNTGSKLWTCVAANQLAGAQRLEGDVESAAKSQQEAESLRKHLLPV